MGVGRGRDNESPARWQCLPWEREESSGTVSCILICFVLILWEVRRDGQFHSGLADFKVLGDIQVETPVENWIHMPET